MINDLQPLAIEYLELVNEGYGTSLGNRTARQIEIANQIVVEALPYVKDIAKRFKGFRLKLKISNGKIARPILKYDNIPLEDLVQNGCLGIVKSIKNYNPKFILSAHLRYTIINAMLISRKQESLVKISYNYYARFRKIVRKKGLQGIIDSGIKYEKAQLLYLAVTDDCEQLEPIEDMIPQKWDVLEFQLDTPEEKEFASEGLLPDEEVANLERNYKVEEFLLTLRPKQRKMLRERYWEGKNDKEIGKILDCSHQNVEQTCKRVFIKPITLKFFKDNND